MQANNETGVIQPLDEITAVLKDHEAYFHVDAAQGFGKVIPALRNTRIDLISVSGHKLYGPKGIGALIMRRRGYKLPPLTPLMFGGGQERGLRPGTLPVHLAVALGEAARISHSEHELRSRKNLQFRNRLVAAFEPLEPEWNGDKAHVLPHVVNLSFTGLDSEAVMVALKSFVAISNGSACTSHSYTPSHVLKSMGLSDDRIAGALRWSWCHLTEEPDWAGIVQAIRRLR
jgi:cysteine desulfurase